MDDKHGSADREHGFAQPALPTPYVNGSIQAFENHYNYNCDQQSPALNPGPTLCTDFDPDKSVTGWDYRFGAAPDSNTSLASTAIASQPEYICAANHTPGYDYKYGLFTNTGGNSSRIPFAKPSVDLGDQIQRSGLDYTCNVAPAPSGDATQLAPVAFDNQELDPGYEYTNDIFGDLWSPQPQNGNPSNCHGVG